MSMMWKSSQTAMASPKPVPEPIRFEPAAPANEYTHRLTPAAVPTPQASIAKGMVFKGTITGNNSLYVDGEVVGNIHLPDGRVTVGPTGYVTDGLSVCIRAREIVVMGKIRGNISAADRVEICAEGHLTGNVSAARISIADGAYFKGDIDLRTAQPKPAVSYIQEEEQTKAYA
jgi:cytoskeletal protein CcmA (bactofilin family)